MLVTAKRVQVPLSPRPEANSDLTLHTFVQERAMPDPPPLEYTMTEHCYHNLVQPHQRNISSAVSPVWSWNPSETPELWVVQNQLMKISSILGLDERRTSDSRLSYLAFESSGQSTTPPPPQQLYPTQRFLNMFCLEYPILHALVSTHIFLHLLSYFCFLCLIWSRMEDRRFFVVHHLYRVPRKNLTNFLYLFKRN